MLSFTEAKKHIANLPLILRIETIPVWKANGRILARDIIAAQDLPAWSNSAMDGYAVQRVDVLQASEQNPVVLPVSDIIQAGSTTSHTLQSKCCVRIFTGAPTPTNADVVIMQENVTVTPEGIVIQKCPKPWNNIRQLGEECTSGEVLLKKGTQLDPATIGLALSASVHHVDVWKQPKVGILSTGDELRDPRNGGTLQTGQIWATNTINLQMAFQTIGLDSVDCGIAEDTLESTRSTLLHAIEKEQVDLLVSTGGVSVGDFDVVHKALADLPGHRVEMNFWKVKMKPGKPVAIGIIYTPNKTIPLFALPGNPVSALMGFYQFVRPYILGKMGVPNPELPTIQVTLGEDFHKRGNRLEFVRIWLDRRQDTTTAFSTGHQSSAWMSSFADATALLPFPADKHLLTKGSTCTVQFLPNTGKWPATWRT
jgi:molybdopterin molybdotransferase